MVVIISFIIPHGNDVFNYRTRLLPNAVGIFILVCIIVYDDDTDVVHN